VQGNCFTWCQEPYYNRYPVVQGDAAVEDKEGELVVNLTNPRVLRGGSRDYPALFVRSAQRDIAAPSAKYLAFGFRLARTLPPVPVTALPLPGAAGTKIEK
jgi:formylglycine-generating enzyme required for sulfatase activity